MSTVSIHTVVCPVSVLLPNSDSHLLTDSLTSLLLDFYSSCVQLGGGTGDVCGESHSRRRGIDNNKTVCLCV